MAIHLHFQEKGILPKLGHQIVPKETKEQFTYISRKRGFYLSWGIRS